MKKQIYLDIKNRLKTILGPDEQPLFRHFDLWNQNVAFIEQETPFEVPAIFIEFSELQWHQLGSRCADADLTIRIHIVTTDFMQTADYSPMEHEALLYLDIADLVCDCLQGYEPACCNRMMRTRSIPNHNHERYVDTMEEFVCRVTWKPEPLPHTMPETVMVRPQLSVIPDPEK